MPLPVLWMTPEESGGSKVCAIAKVLSWMFANLQIVVGLLKNQYPENSCESLLLAIHRYQDMRYRIFGRRFI